jgi:hypothetical protein
MGSGRTGTADARALLVGRAAPAQVGLDLSACAVICQLTTAPFRFCLSFNQVGDPDDEFHFQVGLLMSSILGVCCPRGLSVSTLRRIVSLLRFCVELF